MRVSLLIFLILASPFSFADGISFSVGESRSRWTLAGDTEMRPSTYRLAYVKESPWQWHFFETHKLQVDWEFAYNRWNDPWRDNTIEGLVINPMFRYSIPFSHFDLFAGIGVGATYSNSQDYMDRELGSRWLFEDRLEIGVSANNHHISYSLNHYSNANLASINHGMNINYINYRYTW